MEAITNAASAASKAIFGESATNSSQPTDQTGREPLNGELGDTSKGEPFDAGITDSTDTDLAKPQTNPNTKTADLPIRGKADTLSSTNTRILEAPGNTASTAPSQPEHRHDKTKATDAPHPSAGFTSDKPTFSNEPVSSGAEPSVFSDPSSRAQNTQKQQGADRPEAEPSSNEHEAIQNAKKEAEEAQSVDMSGPGPVPLQERSKIASVGGGNGEDGPQKESHGEGTGGKYVKSTGLQADGGDFDAANPGAAKEADRILKEKGIHHANPSELTGDSAPSDDIADHKKPSLKEKIKAKLHKH